MSRIEMVNGRNKDALSLVDDIITGRLSYSAQLLIQRSLEDIPFLLDEISRLAAQVEQYEKTIKGDCNYCIYNKSYKVPASCKNFDEKNTSSTCNRWQFDYERFAGGERE